MFFKDKKESRVPEVREFTKRTTKKENLLFSSYSGVRPKIYSGLKLNKICNFTPQK